MKTVYFAITNHGFGHATRTASVVAALQHQCSDRQIEFRAILATTAPIWLLESYITQPFSYHPQALDVGVIQSDSLNMDLGATLTSLQDLQIRQAQIIEAEARFLQENQVDLVFADIPPLAAAIAQQANVPCWMCGNFGWDFIYQDWQGFEPIVEWMRDLYGKSDRLLRLPFHENMSAFPNVLDVGFTGGTPRYEASDLQKKLGLSSDRPTVLLTFGGLSLNHIPYQNLARFPDWQFLTFDNHAPELANLINFRASHQDLQLRPVDLLLICDRLVSKPGYSTLSEACRQDVPVVCLTRADFPEAEYLLQGLRSCSQHLIISPEEFYGGNWSFLEQKLNPPDCFLEDRHQEQNQKGVEKYLEKHGEEAIASYLIEEIIK
jgi:hypothetical protein